MAKKQINITLASYNYLYEVQAIPVSIRIKYLEMLLKQKGGSRQKCVMVLKAIYSYADGNTLSRWNPQLICKNIGISEEMLYCHKSRLLKGLRELYFNWKEEEKKIEEVYKSDTASADDEDILNLRERIKVIEMNFAKAKKMAELGMMREAKRMYLKLEESVMKLTNFDVTNANLMRTEIYEFLVFYYYNRRKKNRLKHYNEKLQKVYCIVKGLNWGITPKERSLFDLRKGYSDFHLNMLDWYANGSRKLENNNIEEIYATAKEGGHFDYLYMSLRHRAILKITENNFEAAGKICIEGFELAKQESNIPVTYAFASILHFLRSKTRIPGIRFSYEEILSYYRKAKETIPLNLWTVYLENSISMILYPEILNKAPEILIEQANSNIMLGDLSLAIYWKFIYSSENYIKSLLGHFEYNPGNFLEMNSASRGISEEIENSCFNTLCYHKALSDLGFLYHVYSIQLTAAFFSESDTDIGYSKHIINKIKRLKIKSEHDVRFELLTHAFKMLEHAEHPKYIINKFEYKLKKTLDSCKEQGAEFNIIDYAIISSLARRLKCREISALVKDFYHWLENNHPEILAPAIRDIEERKARIKLFDGSKQTAA